MFPFFDPSMMMFNPMDMAGMTMGMAQSPDVFAQAMAGTGMLPPDPGMFAQNMAPAMGNPAMGGMSFNPQIGGPATGGVAPAIAGMPGAPPMGNDPFAQPFAQPQMAQAAPMPGAVDPTGAGTRMPGAPQPMSPFQAAAKGLSPGSSDQKPIMSGGITGAGQAPKAGMGQTQQSGVAQALMSLLAAGGPPPVPPLLFSGFKG